MSFLIEDDELLEKYNKIWKKVKNSIKKEFDSKPVYKEKHVKAKVKSCNGRINTNFHNNKVPKEGSQFVCLSVIFAILVLEQIKFIILKEKGFLSILLMIQKFFLILMKKTRMKKMKNKKANKNTFFFLDIKITNNYYQKTQRKTLKRST